MEVLGGLVADGGDQLVGKFLALDIDDVGFGAAFLDLAGDGVQQVGFSKTRTAVDKQRVVGAGGILRDSAAGGLGKLVGASDDEGGEGILILAALAVHVDLLLTVGRQHRRGRGGLHRGGGELLLLRIGGGFAQDLHLDREAHHRLKGFGEQAEVFFLHNLLHKFSLDVQNGGVAVKADRFQAFDPNLVSDFRQLFGVDHILPRVLLDHLKQFLK